MRRHRTASFYLIVIACCTTLWMLYRTIADRYSTEPFKSYSDKNEAWYLDWYERLKQGRKVILLYTTWFDHFEWNDYSGRRLYDRMEHCEKTPYCLLTYDKSWIKKAAGVVFHGRDVEENRNCYYSAEKLREVRKGVPLSQKWVFLSHENPWKDIGVYKPYDGLFNWTATFSRKSNIFVPYGSYVQKMKPLMEVRNYAKEKTGLVAWAVSNCGSRLRLDYVRQLQKYVSVTVYGKCNCYFGKRRFCKHHDTDCKKELSKYKFYLAFENDFCHDYVTEKYWERLEQDVVPVVMGSNYDGLVMAGSYIDANDFGSIQELADYLLYLDKNDDEYNKYFAYKRKGVPEGSLYCRICEKLNSDEAKLHTQVTLSQEFNYENNCGVRRAKAEKFQQQIDAARKDDSILVEIFTNIWCWFHKFFH